MNEYDKQANDFLTNTGTDFKAEFLRYGKHFISDENDSPNRDIYMITLTKGSRSYSFEFGQSIVCSGEYIVYPSRERLHKKEALAYVNEKGDRFLNKGNSDKNKDFSPPTPYDVLACLQKYEVGCFKDFCEEFGYDNDSIQAKQIYDAVVREYNNLKMLYNEAELEILREIS